MLKRAVPKTEMAAAAPVVDAAPPPALTRLLTATARLQLSPQGHWQPRVANAAHLPPAGPQRYGPDPAQHRALSQLVGLI